ncbi:MAG: ATP-binding protein [Bacteroidales bacterium]
MKDLSLHILDIVQNSTRAKAKLVEIYFVDSAKRNTIEIMIKDNGKGMNKETLDSVTDPYTTSRTTRKIGLGIPLLKQNVERCEGELSITSQENYGTILNANFKRDHIDRPPTGDLADTIALIFSGNPETNFIFTQITDNGEYTIKTTEIKEAIDGISIADPQVAKLMKEMIRENLLEIC